VVDYPNSKKARKVFLCLFVGEGGGGGAQVPRGLLEGDEAVGAPESEDARAKFERRRQRESRRERNGKQKAVKGGKDWILRKKDVRGAHLIRRICPLLIDRSLQISSYTGDEERTTCLTTQNTQVVKEEQYSRFIHIRGLYCTVLCWYTTNLLLSCSQELSR